jgi:hypothetical protein
MLKRALLLCLLALPVGCGGSEPPPPNEPTLKLDREGMYFGSEFGNAVFVGTRPQESVLVMNEGLQDLVISEVAQAGDAAFELTLPESLTIPGRKFAALRVVFAPTEARQYTGSLTIRSNAANAAEQAIELRGSAVSP